MNRKEWIALKFRYRNYIVTFAVCLVIVVTFTACQKVKTEQFKGMNLACADVQYSATAGKPMDMIKLNGAPSEFEKLLSLIVTSANGEYSLLVPVERDEDGATFHLPVHPELLSSGGEVRMTLIDEKDNYCDSVPFTIHALPDSPGAFKKLANSLVKMGNAQARLLGTDVTLAAHAQLLEENSLAGAHFVVDEILQGAQNQNSIMRIADNDSPLVGDLSVERWELIDGLVEQSGILHALAAYVENLDQMEALSLNDSLANRNSTISGLVTVSSIEEIPLTCGTGWHRPDAALLDKMMNMQIKNEIFGDGTELLDAAGLMWGAAGVLAAAGGVPQATKVSNIVGTTINLTKIRYEAMEGLLPSEFVELKVDINPATFLEDDEKLDGSWDKALVTAKSRGWSADKAAFETLLNLLGSRVSKGAQAHYKLEFEEGTKAMGQFTSQLWDSQLTNRLFGKETNRTGIYEFPPCEFGPTDITDENWSDVRINPEGTAPVYLVDRYTYRAQATGEATLEVSPRGDRFGRRAFNPNGTFFFKDTRIEVLPIEVIVSPSEMTFKPGTSTQLRATVHNANDTGVAWEVHPTGAHRITVRTDPNGKSILMIDTSYNEADFPVTLTAVSTSSMGLRALPDAPRREGHGLLRSTSSSIEISPDECCVEPGEQQAFQAVIHNFSNQRVTWSASAGMIDESGLFTAPDQGAIVTVTATSVADPSLKKSVPVRVGDCTCSAEWEISSFQEKQSSNTSRMERAGEDGEGRLTKLLFTNLLNGENLQIIFEGNGPLPGDQGTYPVKIINVGNEMSDRSVLFKNGVIAGVPSPHHPNGFYMIPPPALRDGNAEPMSDELKATVTIDEFTQLGSEHHHVWISGTIQGEVEAAEYKEYLSSEENMSTVHLIGTIRGSFQGHYTVRHKNPAVNPLADLGFELPFLGGASVYWDVCGMEETEIPFMEPLNLQDIIHSDEYIAPMDPDERIEFEDLKEILKLLEK